MEAGDSGNVRGCRAREGAQGAAEGLVPVLGAAAAANRWWWNSTPAQPSSSSSSSLSCWFSLSSQQCQTLALQIHPALARNGTFAFQHKEFPEHPSFLKNSPQLDFSSFPCSQHFFTISFPLFVTLVTPMSESLSLNLPLLQFGISPNLGVSVPGDVVVSQPRFGISLFLPLSQSC